jgi:hypothetical protein
VDNPLDVKEDDEHAFGSVLHLSFTFFNLGDFGHFTYSLL